MISHIRAGFMPSPRNSNQQSPTEITSGTPYFSRYDQKCFLAAFGVKTRFSSFLSVIVY